MKRRGNLRGRQDPVAMELKIEHVPIAQVKLNPGNPRKIGIKEFESLIQSLRSCPELFEARPLLCSNRTGELIVLGGNMRLRAALKLAYKTVPVIVLPPLTEAQEREITIKDNGSWGAWDYEALAANWGDVPLVDWGVALPDNWNQVDEEPQDTPPRVDQAEELNKKWKVEPGAIFEIGAHRLLCGDSTNRDHVARLMADEKADAVFTDPPYGVSYLGTNNPNGKSWAALENDNLRGEELRSFLLGAFKNAAEFTKDNIALYCWHASSTQIQFEQALNEAGFQVKQQLIWNKGMVLGHSDYHWAHEPVFYCKKKNGTTPWYGDRTAKTILGNRRSDFTKLKKEDLIAILMAAMNTSTTWEIDRDRIQEYQHSTQKPIALAIRALINSSDMGQLVLDLFLGSGSSMVACENIGRRCFGIEFSPNYCAVILERMSATFPKLQIRQAK